jgi:uncharacterized protein (TIGR03000 family)
MTTVRLIFVAVLTSGLLGCRNTVVYKPPSEPPVYSEIEQLDKDLKGLENRLEAICGKDRLAKVLLFPQQQICSLPNPPKTPKPPLVPVEFPKIEPERPLPETFSSVIVVHVPQDAQVTVNGFTTNQSGHQRRFISYLKPDFTYPFEIQVRLLRNGWIQEKNQKVVLRANQIANVTFHF